MNIYHVSTDKNLGYDSYSEFVIVCKTKEIARNSHPMNGEYKWWTNERYVGKHDSWVMEEDVPSLEVENVGVAKKGAEGGILCASFHAG